MKRLLILFTALLFAPTLWAACSNTNLGNGITCVQRVFNTSCPLTTTCTTTISATAAGNTLIVSMNWFDAAQFNGSSHDCTQTASLTDNKSSVYSNGLIQAWDTGNSFSSATCYLPNIASGITSVTYTLTATTGDGAYMSVTEISGVTTTPLDKTASGSVAGCPGSCGTSSAPTTAATATLSQANEYAFCWGSHNVPSTTYSAAGGGFAIANQSGNAGIFDQAVTATTALTCSATLSVAREWNMQLLTFKASGAATPKRLRGAVINNP